MYACLVLYVYIIQPHRTDTFHIHRTSAQEYKTNSLKQGQVKQHVNHLKTTPSKETESQKLPPHF